MFGTRFYIPGAYAWQRDLRKHPPLRIRPLKTGMVIEKATWIKRQKLVERGLGTMQAQK
jgi:hypothetical protein